jgi:hypothetical protein
MYAEIVGAINSVKIVNDLLKAAHTLSNYNELVAAVAEVNAKLMTASTVALESQEKQATLAQRVGELEKEIVKLKNWKRKAKRYQRTEIAPSVFAYDLKPGMEHGETAHHLCANCFEKGEESTLQADAAGTKVYTYSCPRCQNKFPVASQSITVPVIRG